jgi:hypothetical protein
MHYLRNSAEIREQLHRLFSGGGRKWAVVGFVGYNAVDHLPKDVSDLSVVCWQKAGGTNPDGVRRLIDKGVAVYFCRRLHQKIYWRENTGLIVGSANLSDNALGEDGLHEFAVYCDDRDFDINQVLSSLKYEAVSTDALARLDVEHTAYARNSPVDHYHRTRPPRTFVPATNTRHRKPWKMVTWTELRENSDHIQQVVKAQFGTNDWANDNDVTSDSFEKGDFVLQVKTNDDGIIERANARWLLVDTVAGRRGDRVIVQVNKLDSRTPPPFELDSAFKKNLKRAFNETTEWDAILDRHGVVRPRFLQSIMDLYGSDREARRGRT